MRKNTKVSFEGVLSVLALGRVSFCGFCASHLLGLVETCPWVGGIYTPFFDTRLNNTAGRIL